MIPISIVISIISAITSIVMGITGTIVIIKFGRDISDNVEDFFKSIGKEKVIINKMSSVPAFIGVCQFLNDNRSQIICNKWLLLTLSDAKWNSKNNEITRSW